MRREEDLMKWVLMDFGVALLNHMVEEKKDVDFFTMRDLVEVVKKFMEEKNLDG